jgi:hypothetical protein
MQMVKQVWLIGAGLFATLNFLQAQPTPPSNGGNTNGGSYTNINFVSPYVPGLKLSIPAGSGTNLPINLLEADPAGTYGLYAASNLTGATWSSILQGTNSQTNFTLPFPFSGMGFLRAARTDTPVTNTAAMTVTFPNNDENTNVVSASITGGPAAAMAVLVNETNLADAVWIPFSAVPYVLLGTNDGVYQVEFGFIGSDGQTNWTSASVTLDTTPPLLVITSPAAGTVSVPVVQVQGYAIEPLASLTFDVSNAAGIFTNQTGYLAGEAYDTNLLAFTTTYFQCYDVPLTNGANTITIHAIDLAGNVTTTNLNLTLDYSGDTTAPALTVLWPTNGTYISGDSFTFHGLMDDATATVTATIVDGSGDTNTVSGLVERDGTVWAQNLPLNAGTNTLTITATDAAGNSSTTNLTVYQSGVTVTLDSPSLLNQVSVTVTGTISDPSGEVCIQVNGTNAYYLDDLGDWEADYVPVSPTGAATFDVELYTNDPVNIGSQVFAVPQPPTVGLMSYGGHHEYAFQDSVSWLYSSGGVWTYHEPAYGENPERNYVENIDPDGANYAPPLFAGLPMLPPWENAATDGNSTQTRVMLEPAKLSASAGNKQYLIRATAAEFSDPTANEIYSYGGLLDNFDDLFGDVPLPPAWLQINGQPLVNAGITNTDGTVEGVVLLSLPAGANAPLTVTATRFYTNNDYTFDVQVGKTKADWQQDVQKEIDAGSGVAIENYVATNGFMNNRSNIKAIYNFYQKQFTNQPARFYWAGLAKLVGAPVYAGLSDVEYTKSSSFLMIPFTLLGIGTNDLTAFQNELIQMNIDIYNDLAWQFEAYNNSGLNALQEIYAGETNALDSTNIAAWREIDDGVQNSNGGEIQNGNEQLAYHEQFTILQPDYNVLSSMGALTHFLTIFANNPVPTGTNFTTVVPGGNICVFNDRWKWVTNSAGIWPPWITASPTTQSAWANIPLTTRANTYATYPPVY